MAKKSQWRLDGRFQPENTDTSSTFKGICTVVLPSGLKGSWNLATLYKGDWTTLTLADKWIYYYGFKQKAMDSVAKSEGLTLTDEEKLVAYDLMYERLDGDVWNMEGIARVSKAVKALRDCKEESEMRLLERLGLVTNEDIARELLRREGLA